MARNTAEANVIVRSKQAGKKVYSDLHKQLDTLRAGVGKLSIGLAAGSTAVAVLTARGLQNVDALAKQADRIGTTTEKLAALQHLTQIYGGSTETLTEALTKAQKRLGEFAATGSGAAAPWLERMNLNTRELIALSPDELFQRYAEEIGSLNSRGEQLAAISALMGDESRSLINLMDAGSGIFAEAEAEVTRYGIALSRVDAAKVEAANDSLFRARQRVAGLGNVLASRFAPLITAVANRFLDAGDSAEVFGEQIDRMVDRGAVSIGALADIVYGLQLTFRLIETHQLRHWSKLVGLIASVEEAGTRANNVFRELFDSETQDPSLGFFRSIELSLEQSADFAKHQLEALAATEKPSVRFARAIGQARVQAEASARAVAETANRFEDLNLPTFDTNLREDKASAAQEKALEKAREHAERGLAQVVEFTAAKETVEALAFQRRQEMVLNAVDMEILTEQQGAEIIAQLHSDLQDRLTKIHEAGLTERLKFQQASGKEQAKDVFGTLETITAGVANSNKTLFRLNQASAIANAIVNTYEGVTKTLAKYPWPLSAVFAATHLAAGLAQVQAIRSASFGGGTTPSLAGSTPSFNSQPVSTQSNQAEQAPAGPQRVFQVNIYGSVVGDQGVYDVLERALRELVDADAVIIPGNSLQAEEIRTGRSI